MPSGKTHYRCQAAERRNHGRQSTAPANPSMPIRHRLARPRRNPSAPVFVDRKKFRTLCGPNIATEFKAMVIDYIDQRYGAGAKVPAETAG